MARYVVAVSGGVDSIALLDMLHELGTHELIVAHFDHGIRHDSEVDAAFVGTVAEQYGLPFFTFREELGEDASEQLARDRRYAFLQKLARKYEAAIVTAHHADDVVETVAINLSRGTGWRGLATHDAEHLRPLLSKTKEELRHYAQRRGLQWRDDPSNENEKYLRNRVRKVAKDMPVAEKKQLMALRSEQLKVKKFIELEVRQLIGDGPEYSRYFFTHISHKAAVECLRYVTKAQLTRPQMERALLAIKTARVGATHQAGNGVVLEFTARNFTVALLK